MSWHIFRSEGNEVSGQRTSLSDSEKTALYVVSSVLGMLLCFLLALCHHRHRRFSRHPGVASRVGAMNVPSPPPPPARMNPPRILSFSIPQRDLVDTVCPICLEDLHNTSIRAGACMHPVHALCLAQWLLQDDNVSCPVCRATYQVLPPECKSDSYELTSADRVDAHVVAVSLERDDTVERSIELSSHHNNHNNHHNQPETLSSQSNHRRVQVIQVQVENNSDRQQQTSISDHSTNVQQINQSEQPSQFQNVHNICSRADSLPRVHTGESSMSFHDLAVSTNQGDMSNNQGSSPMARTNENSSDGGKLKN